MYLTCSSESLTSMLRMQSSSFSMLVVPIIGAEQKDLFICQASETCAIDTPRSLATFSTRVMISFVASEDSSGLRPSFSPRAVSCFLESGRLKSPVSKIVSRRRTSCSKG